MRISDWSSDVCSSDLARSLWRNLSASSIVRRVMQGMSRPGTVKDRARPPVHKMSRSQLDTQPLSSLTVRASRSIEIALRLLRQSIFRESSRSEEHTSELQSLMRISYAVFCLKKKKKNHIVYDTLYTQDILSNTYLT